MHTCFVLTLYSKQVYTQVTALFHGAPDLLDEFKAFLPDTSDPQAQPAQQLQTQTAPLPSSGQKKKVSGAPGSGRTKLSTVGANGTVGSIPGGGEEKKKRAAPGMGERSKVSIFPLLSGSKVRECS